MATPTVKASLRYEYLESRPGSFYSELFMRGLNLRPSRLVVSMEAEGLTPEQMAADRDLPLEAVLEAIEYVANNAALIQHDMDREHQLLKDRGLLEAGDA